MAAKCCDEVDDMARPAWLLVPFGGEHVFIACEEHLVSELRRIEASKPGSKIVVRQMATAERLA